jgi:hypothetical protein
LLLIIFLYFNFVFYMKIISAFFSTHKSTGLFTHYKTFLDQVLSKIYMFFAELNQAISLI